ncbi:DUF3048 domain-containing protein [Marmoricola sp. OAE513]|uniref:DUF3048 domain-containing protein n=1 Tax=Marmoricola sp. OAE513 TaxID=2817894 RepID=UPI001AEB59AA
MHTPSKRFTKSRRPLLLALIAALVASLVLAGCGSDKKKEAGDERPQSQPTEGGTQLAAVWPLTGLPAPATTPNHPVIVVKIDNSRASDPQYGLGSADMVVEEMVEGGYTRLAVAFYSKLPKKVGPVRSARASDIGIVKPTHAVLVASGAAPKTKGRLNQAGIRLYEEGSKGTYRDRSEHDALHSVFIDLPKFATSVKKKAIVPANYLPWGTESDYVGVRPAKTISVRFSPITTTVFKWNGKKYLNTDTYARRGDQFKADSVLVIRTREGDAGYLDPAGNKVPETLFFGQGTFLLFHKGQALRGTWTKADRAAPLELSTAAGPVKVPAGHVWVELLPGDNFGGKLTYTP